MPEPDHIDREGAHSNESSPTPSSHESNEAPVVRPHPPSRVRWAQRALGLAHLIILGAWWGGERDLIYGGGIFEGYLAETPDIVATVAGWPAEITWLIGGLILMSGRLTSVGALFALVGMGFTLAPLPSDLISPVDQVLLTTTSLFALSGLAARGRSGHHHSRFILTWGAWLLFTLWAWTSLQELLDVDHRLWRRGYALNFWGWTEAVPTPLTLPLHTHLGWARQYIGVMILAGLAWGPLLLLARVSLWPLFWLICAPLALYVGGGVPSALGTLVVIVSLSLLDERVSWGLGGRFSRMIRAKRESGQLGNIASRGVMLLSPHIIFSAPLALSLLWLCLGLHCGVASLVALSLWGAWMRAPTDQQQPSHSAPNMLSLALIMIWGIFISAQLTAQGSLSSQREGWAHRWLPFERTQEWVHTARTRSRLIIEMSEDAGGSWTVHTPADLTLVTMRDQPWRPLQPLRYERWYHSLNQQLESEEGPFIELLERMLRARIFKLRETDPKVNIQAILIRARRERWVRSSHQFWRAEGRGIFSINTNLPVLLKARATIREARKTKPKMPHLIETPSTSAQP